MALFRYAQNPIESLLAHHPIFGALDTHVDASETGGRHRSLWSPEVLNAPRVDVHELDNSFELSAELPGFKKEDVSLQVDEKTRKITISGESHAEYHGDESSSSSGGGDVHAASAKGKEGGDKDKDKGRAAKKAKAIVNERTYGYCSRSFMLPESADLSQVKAKFDSGVLKVSVPKVVKQKVEPRRVTIEDAGTQ